MFNLFFYWVTELINLFLVLGIVAQHFSCNVILIFICLYYYLKIDYYVARMHNYVMVYALCIHEK